MLVFWCFYCYFEKVFLNRDLFAKNNVQSFNFVNVSKAEISENNYFLQFILKKQKNILWSYGWLPATSNGKVNRLLTSGVIW